VAPWIQIPPQWLLLPPLLLSLPPLPPLPLLQAEREALLLAGLLVGRSALTDTGMFQYWYRYRYGCLYRHQKLATRPMARRTVTPTTRAVLLTRRMVMLS